jgi:ABC-type transport system involved in cytochrome c biogenesis permease subunit
MRLMGVWVLGSECECGWRRHLFSSRSLCETNRTFSITWLLLWEISLNIKMIKNTITFCIYLLAFIAVYFFGLESNGGTHTIPLSFLLSVLFIFIGIIWFLVELIQFKKNKNHSGVVFIFHLSGILLFILYLYHHVRNYWFYPGSNFFIFKGY